MARRTLMRSGLPFVAAVVVWAASWCPLELPMVAGVVALGLAAVIRRPLAIVCLLAVAVAVFAAHALAGLSPPPRQSWAGTATLVSDPVERAGGSIAEARTDIGRLELAAWGPAGRLLSERVAGEVVTVEGDLGASRSVRTSDHLRGRLRVDRVARTGRTEWTMRLPNVVRGLVVDGAQGLPAGQRAVYAGFVLGDDRGRSDELTEWFASAGLSHLLVVSGQNLAFVMLLVGPVLNRVGMRARLVATATVLVGFAAVTRFEPSVLRASAMAGVAALAVFHGRPADGRRVLAIAVTALVVIDPLLTRSIGFQSSVAASAGIVLFATAIARRLRGPERLRAVLAVTIAAQLGVAPVLVPRFGPMPLVAIPANVLAEPVAGLVMMWGSSVGLVAGLVGQPLAGVLLLPARVGLWWITGVARVASALPTIGVDAPVALALVFVVAVSMLLRRRARIGHPVA